MYSALFGGALIGLSAVILMLSNGRIAGVSGIAYGVFSGSWNERLWRMLFIVGLIFGGFIYAKSTHLLLMPDRTIPFSTLLAGGFLVGFGTRLGNGCTSGHGVCGLARLSLRSLIAVITFLLCAMLTVYITHYLIP